MSCCSACAQHACACGCGAVATTPLPLYNRPGLDSLAYRVGTWADFRAAMQAALSDASLPALRQLRTREEDDPAIALLDAWAVGADVLTFYQERIANEGFLRTATERRSVVELARLVDYRPRPGVAASVYLAYTIEANSPPVTIPASARAQSIPAPGEQMQTFETAEPLDARAEWNALRPRLTRPQDITVDNVATLDVLWVASAATHLKANDRLLFVFGDLARGGVPAIRRVQSVTAEPQSGRSRVALQSAGPATSAILTAMTTAIGALNGDWLMLVRRARRQLLLGASTGGSADEFLTSFELGRLADGPPAARAFVDAVERAFGGTSDGGSASGDFRGLFKALALAPALQPRSPLRLRRSLDATLAAPSDTRPQLLLNFAPRLLDTFYGAWTSVAHGEPSPQLGGVYAMRVAAALFGYNAPQIMTVTQTPTGKRGSTSTITGTDPQPAEHPNVLRLDNAYDGVTAGGYVAIYAPGADPTVARVRVAQVHPESSYGVSGRTTEITLDDASLPNPPGAWQVTDMPTLRQTQVYAQSEALALAERVIADDVGAPAADGAGGDGGDDATHVTLDGAVDGLKSGRWVIVSGQRTDVPGTDAVNASELVMLAGVEQGADASLPGDTVHSTLVLANAGLAYRYRRDTVTINANVVRATHGETRSEVLGNGNGAVALQAFALKQSPLTWTSAPTVDGVASTLAVRVNGVEWHAIENLAFASAADRSFATATGEGGKTTVQFGDGSHGARLPTGIENVTAAYRNGIGTPGNVAAQQISLVATKPLGVKAVINPLRASGGADAETRDQARRNVPLAVLALDRLVSVSDYADFARTFGGVGKAAAVKLGNSVQVTIAGAGDAPIDPTSDLYQNLLQALQRYGDPSLPVGLAVRELLALTLSAQIGVAPDYAWEDVEPVLRATLLQAFGFEQRALAQGVHQSEVVACLQAVRGVAWVNLDALGSLDEATLLAGFGDGGTDGTGNANASAPPLQPGAATDPATGLNPYVPALPPRYAAGGTTLLGAQLVYLLPDVPDTLLLQEATP
jgi:hypothetical protein